MFAARWRARAGSLCAALTSPARRSPEPGERSGSSLGGRAFGGGWLGTRQSFRALGPHSGRARARSAESARARHGIKWLARSARPPEVGHQCSSANSANGPIVQQDPGVETSVN